MTEADYREALVDMCFQFAYRGMQGEQRILHAGGLSALEYAFRTLGWENPHVVLDNACEIAGCEQWCSCVGPYPRSLAKPGLEPAHMIGFGYLCSEHYFTWSGPTAKPAADLGRVK
jgi:hypothetical protein